MEASTTEFDVEGAVSTIQEFIESKVEEAGAGGVVVGLSGGIDSATSSALAVEALGPERVHGLVMPGESTREHNTRDAHRHAESLGIDCKEIEIQPIVDEFVDALPEAAGHREAVGNVRARTRMVLEYFSANANGYMVLGTGNRTELLVGYFTKYGDGAVDILPIGSLYKTEVKEVARHLGVDEDIIEKPPTAGLWEGQTDEDELGADYGTIDTVLRCLVDSGLSVDETVDETGVDRQLVERFKTMYEVSEHKRDMPPYPEVGRVQKT